MTPRLLGKAETHVARRNLAMILIVVLINGIAITAHSRPASACSCGVELLPLKERVDRYDIAFSGRQVRRTVTNAAGHYSVKLTFEVDQVFKGEVSSRTEVWTTESLCGVDFGWRGEVGIVAKLDGEKAIFPMCSFPGSVDHIETAFGPGRKPPWFPPWISRVGAGTLAIMTAIGMALTSRRPRPGAT